MEPPQPQLQPQPNHSPNPDPAYAPPSPPQPSAPANQQPLNPQYPEPPNPQPPTPQPVPLSPQPVPQAVYPNYPQTAGPVQPQPPAAQDDEQKDFVIAFLLSWLLGGVGADRFYLGYTGKGIAKLLTLGGLGIWAIIDTVRLAFGKLRDKEGLPLRGYEKNKTWVRILALLHLIILGLIIVGIFFALILTTVKGVNQKAADVERRTDIDAISSSLAVYHGLAFKYPTLSDINSADFRRIHMQGLPDSALQDPNEHSPTLLSSPGFAAYSYEPLPTGCDNIAGNDCTSYKLTALLDAGGTYVRQSQ
jgi:hypothetical protein